MRGVAGDHNGAAAHLFQTAHCAQEPGQRILALVEFRGHAIWNARIGPQDGRDMVLVTLGRREQGQAEHELGTGQGPHATQNAEGFFVRHRMWFRRLGWRSCAGYDGLQPLALVCHGCSGHGMSSGKSGIIVFSRI